EQQRIVAVRAAQLGQRRHQEADAAQIERRDQRGAHAQAQGARGDGVVSEKVERGLGHAEGQVGGRVGRAAELVGGQQRERAARALGQRGRRRGKVGRGDG